MLYITWWILPGGIHFFVLSKIYAAEPYTIWMDSLISFSLLALFGLSIWYLVRYTNISRKISSKELRIQLLALLLVFFLWNLFSVLFLSILLPSYLSLFLDTIVWRLLIFLPFYFILIIVYYSFASADILRDKELITSKMESQLKQAELNALKAQINPHFLFNSLNSATALTVSNPPAAREMIVNISNFFRFSLMAGKQAFVNLQEEIENALLYLEIEKSRFGDKLEVSCQLPESLEEIQVPSMILQPLVENCVKHSVYESTVPVKIEFFFSEDTNAVFITLINSLDTESGSSRKGTGTGLRNVSSRLSLIYGSETLLQTSRDSEHFTVKLIIPKITPDE